MKKAGSWIMLVVLVCGVGFLLMQIFAEKEKAADNPLVTEEKEGSNSKAHEEKYEAVTIEGYLTKEGDNFTMMGWELQGNTKELEAAVDHYVKAEGKGEDFILEVNVLTVSEELSQSTEEVVTLDGTLSTVEGEYFLDNYKVKGEIDLTPYIDKTIHLQGRKTEVANEIETIEVNETTIISGVLEYVAGEPPDIHYTLEGTDFDIHHNSEIFSLEGEYLELLVYAKSHGSHIDDDHVTLIRVIE